MEFTVIVCTYNRAANLPRCLGALAEQQGVDDREWEVLVVDNNSSDNTAETARALSNTLPIKIRCVRETEQGLNFARNRGIRESNGRYFCYVDDDILVSKNWLSSLFAAFENNDADAVGGRIHLDPGVRLPQWIRPDTDMMGFLGYQDLGDVPLRLDGNDRYPFGGNMAFHRRVVDRIGFFNPLLGRKGAGRKRSELFKGAETDYFHRLAAAGDAHIYYEPRAIVYHQIQPFQLEKRYFRTIHFNAGYQRAYFDDTSFRHRLLGIPRYYYAMLMRMSASYFWQVVTQGSDWAFRQQMNVAHHCGAMMGYYQRRKRGV